MYATKDRSEKVSVGVALEGARRATDEATRKINSVPDPEVAAKRDRRRFTTKYKLQMLEQADQCRTPGETGALLRREGLYSSHLSNWRRLRREGTLQRLSAQKRGPKPAVDTAEKRKIARLRKQNEKLQRELEKAHTIIDVQKKLSKILSMTEDEEGTS